MFYGPALIEGVLGYSSPTPDWYFGLYYSGTDPVTDLATAEIIRVPAPTMGADLSGSWSNTEEFLIGPISSCTAGGWFFANGLTETDVIWVASFATPVTIGDNNYAQFSIGSVSISITNA